MSPGGGGEGARRSERGPLQVPAFGLTASGRAAARQPEKVLAAMREARFRSGALICWPAQALSAPRRRPGPALTLLTPQQPLPPYLSPISRSALQRKQGNQNTAGAGGCVAGALPCISSHNRATLSARCCCCSCCCCCCCCCCCYCYCRRPGPSPQVRKSMIMSLTLKIKGGLRLVCRPHSGGWGGAAAAAEELAPAGPLD